MKKQRQEHSEIAAWEENNNNNPITSKDFSNLQNWVFNCWLLNQLSTVGNNSRHSFVIWTGLEDSTDTF